MEIYHERQSLQLCALHALNNLFQDEVFTKKQLDVLSNRMVEGLSGKTNSIVSHFRNPHKSPLGTGNYDANVIFAAIQEKGYQTIWFDSRKEVKEIDLNSIFGLLLNASTKRLFGLFTTKHWFTIKNIHGIWMNLDSSFSSPHHFESEQKLLEYLEQMVKEEATEILLVVKPSISGYKSSLSSLLPLNPPSPILLHRDESS